MLHASIAGWSTYHVALEHWALAAAVSLAKLARRIRSWVQIHREPLIHKVMKLLLMLLLLLIVHDTA